MNNNNRICNSFRNSILRAVLGCGFLITLGISHATPIISVDLDPATAGIQSVLSVDVGTTFTIDVMITEDGLTPTPTIFDTVILDLSFNDAGVVLGAGPTGAIAGSLAGAPLTFDVFGGFIPTMTGNPLGSVPAAPLSGYSNSGGAISLLNFALFTVVPGTEQSIFSFDFTALGVGTSSILAAGTPEGSPELALFGVPIFANLAPGTITVQRGGQPVPEPNTLAFLFIGLVGYSYQAWRRRLANFDKTF